MTELKTITRWPAGVVDLPPSKSLSHRAVICAALAAWGSGAASLITNLGDSEDVQATLRGVEALGVRWQQSPAGLRIGGAQPGPANSSTAASTAAVRIDCAESGSTLRFLIPIAAALSSAPTIFTGHGRLLQRPQSVYADVFSGIGVAFEQSASQLQVCGPLPSGCYRLPGNVSSQFVSGLLLALPLVAGDSELILTTELESRDYVAMTLAVMADFGVRGDQPSPDRFWIPGGQVYQAATYRVEADYSQSAYFLGAAALGQAVWCRGLHPQSAQGDRAILALLESMGAQLCYQDDLVTARCERLRALAIDAREIPDLVPPLAVLCSLAAGTSRIENAGRLRLKESDRLAALTSELTKLGAQIQEGPDYLEITGQPSLVGGRVEAWGDHRIAMSMALAALGCREPVELSGWQSVRKSYPNFWQDFERDTQRRLEQLATDPDNRLPGRNDRQTDTEATPLVEQEQRS
ncbi:MAG: 3-phosphoshikimate 1-carboxyvinyltransferase [Actinomycetia bacterium]|nr:3-phosphoshikimate 1-carboxyvinyltransferase [Actinomycetes bacterium]